MEQFLVALAAYAGGYLVGRVFGPYSGRISHGRRIVELLGRGSP